MSRTLNAAVAITAVLALAACDKLPFGQQTASSTAGDYEGGATVTVATKRVSDGETPGCSDEWGVGHHLLGFVDPHGLG